MKVLFSFSNFFEEKIIIAAEIADWEVCVT